MDKEEARKILESAPINEESIKYNYFLIYDLEKKLWYAAYDGDKGTSWYVWMDDNFNLIMRLKFDYLKSGISLDELRKIIG